MTKWMDRFATRERSFEELLKEISQSAADPIDLDAYCDLVLHQIGEAFHAQSVGLFLRQKAASRFYLSARLGLAARDMQFGLRHPLPVYLDRNPAPLFATEFNILPQFRALWEVEYRDLQQLKAVLFLPMKAGGELVGILAMGPKHSDATYSVKEQKELTLLANQAALVIQLKYLTTSETRWRQEAELMQRALSEITTDCELEEALNRNLLHLRDVFPCESTYLLLLQNDRLIAAATLGVENPAEWVGREASATDNEPFRSIQEERQAVVVEDTHKDPRFKHYSGLPVLESWMGLPLLTQGEVTGLLVLNSHKPETFQVNPARLELIQALANQAAIMVEKAHLFKVERQQRQSADTLRHLSSEVGPTADFDQLLEFLLDRICQALPADVTMLFLAKGSQFQLTKTRISETLEPEVADAFNQPDFEAAAFANLHYLLNSAQPQVIPDTAKDPEWVPEPAGIRSWAGVQVLLDGKVTACFTFSSLKPGTYPRENSELLTIFAEQAAMTLHNFYLSNEVRELATHDDLTGIFNQRHFLDLGEREFRRARRFQRPLSVMIIDVDYFRKVNETHGVDAGDQVLRAVAEVCKVNIRLVDVLGRINGEMFAIILTETDQPGAKIISDRLRELIANSPIITTTGLVKITVSMGLAVMEPVMPNLDALLVCAREALDQAKQAGRNRVQVYHE